jgi:hypothetical protein
MQKTKLGTKKTKVAKDVKWDARVRFQAGLRVGTEEFSVWATSAKVAVNKAMSLIGTAAIDADVRKA